MSAPPGTLATHVPYRGAGPALQDVMASQADMAFDPGIAFPHIKSGKVKLLAVASDKKSPFFPDVPTYADLGIKDAGLDIWFGVWLPNNTPAEAATRLQRELAKVLASPAVKQRFGDLGAATQRLADELSLQYYIGYNNGGKKDGKWHAIKVDVRNNRHLTVRARKGYVAS